MSKQKIIVGIFSIFYIINANAQKADSSKMLPDVTVTGYKTVNGVAHLPERKNGIIYAGKKNEIILVNNQQSRFNCK